MTVDGSLFLHEFVRSPLRTASVVPSSPSLAMRMVASIPEHGEPVVVELGPGTGAFTAAIQARLAGRGRHVAIELNPSMSAYLAERFPGVEVVTGGASDMASVLASRGIPAADVVVSGLPWSAFSGPVGKALITTIASTMSPAGVYTQFSYSWTRWAPPARRQLAQLRSAFEEVVVSRTTWRNVPPATVYVSRRPRVRSAVDSNSELTAPAELFSLR